MDCPVCKNVTLAVSERQGIEIDYCPHCRGVWLDRGELDKIIDRTAPDARMDSQAASYPSRPAAPQDYHDPRHHGHYRKRKREGFLSDLFDFD